MNTGPRFNLTSQQMLEFWQHSSARKTFLSRPDINPISSLSEKELEKRWFHFLPAHIRNNSLWPLFPLKDDILEIDNFPPLPHKIDHAELIQHLITFHKAHHVDQFYPQHHEVLAQVPSDILQEALRSGPLIYITRPLIPDMNAEEYLAKVAPFHGIHVGLTSFYRLPHLIDKNRIISLLPPPIPQGTSDMRLINRGEQAYFSFGHFQRNEYIHLIRTGANPNVQRKSSGNTPLHFAAGQIFDFEITKLLIEYGASLSAKNINEETPLFLLSKSTGDKVRIAKTAEILLESGSEVDTRNNVNSTPLMEAAYRGNFELVKLLVEYGANINAEDKDGDTAIQLAQQNGHKRIVAFLKKQLENPKNYPSSTHRTDPIKTIQPNPQTAKEQIWQEAIDDFLELIEHNPTPELLRHKAQELIQTYKQTARDFDTKIHDQYGLKFEIDRDNVEIAILAELIFSKGIANDGIGNLISQAQKAREDSVRDEALNIAIVGAGPLGLVSTFRSYINGANVTLLEKRPKYKREQIMGLDAPFVSWFEQTLGKKYSQILHALGILEERPDWHDIRPDQEAQGTFHSERIQQMENSLALFLNALMQKDTKHLKIMRRVSYTGIVKPSNYDIPWSVQITSDHDNDTQSFPADIIIGADGSSGISKQAFEIQTVAESNNHWAGTALFVNKDLLGFQGSIRNLNANADKIKILADLKKLGWKQDRLPATRFFINGDIIYLGTEIPQEMGDAFKKDENKRKQWFLELIKLHLPNPLLKKLKWVEHVQPTTIFNVQSFRSQFVTQELSRFDTTIRYFAVGDTAGTPHFLTRSGVNTGFYHTALLERVLKVYQQGGNTSVSAREYNQLVQESLDELFHKPTNDETFTDGPFLRHLTPEEIEARERLIAKGQLRISYEDILKELQSK